MLTFAGDHTTAGLELPLFFGPDAGPFQPAAAVGPFGLQRRLTKPLVTAVQGITFTIGIEIALAGDIVVAASDTRFCQLEPKRGLAPLAGATIRYVQRAGWGNAMYHLLRADEFGAGEALRIGLVQEVVKAGGQREAPSPRASASISSSAWLIVQVCARHLAQPLRIWALNVSRGGTTLLAPMPATCQEGGELAREGRCAWAMAG